MFDNILPPPEFDKPYAGELIIERMATPELLHERCWHPGKSSKRILACAISSADGTKCIIVWPSYESLFPRKFVENMWRHEIGHCNGWRHPETNPFSDKVR